MGLALFDFIIGVLFLIFGYVVGKTLKFGVKIIFIVIVALLIFYILSMLTKGMMFKLGEKVVFLRDVCSKFGIDYRMLNFGFLMFIFGLLFGIPLDKS